MAVYSILVLLLVIYNPLVAPLGLRFFAEDRWAYMRIFYLLPLMPVIAYAVTDYYADTIDITEKKERKIKFLCVICVIIMLCGAAYGSNMYIKADNIYKIDDQAEKFVQYYRIMRTLFMESDSIQVILLLQGIRTESVI